FLATTKVLMASVRAGVGRETAHEAISEHAVAVALQLREKGASTNDLLERLAEDERIPLRHSELQGLLADPLSFTGLAGSQVSALAMRVNTLLERFPAAAGYVPEPIL
ncbi:MAG: adenylosuccinate lyase, partial [Sciscionella sp.]